MKTGTDLIKDIDAAKVASGEAVFWWIGQLGYVVKCADAVLYFDPYLAPKETRTVPPMLDPATIVHADWVFCTHDHSDHLDPVAVRGIAAASPKTRFVAARTAGKRLSELGVGPERMVLLDAGQRYEGAGIAIEAVAAQHEFFDVDPVLGHPFLSFIVECGGVRILHTGDTLRYDGYEAALARYSYDLAFAPINGRDGERLAKNIKGNMTFQETVDLFGVLKPGLAVPGHYEMFAHNSQDPAAFARYMDVKFPDVRYWIGEHGEPVRVTSIRRAS